VIRDSASPSSGQRLATIDLGTNTVRLLVVAVGDRGWENLREAQRVTRLGQGQGMGGALQEEPMARTASTVAEFVAAARALGASRVRLVATSAVREAPNGQLFAARLRQATGCAIEVLSGEDEARLALLGVSAGLPSLREAFVLLDIGGGSTEVVLARSGRAAAWVSLQLGVVALAERFMDSGPLDRARYDEMAREIEERLSREMPDAIAAGHARVLVGTAGTVTALAALALGLSSYDSARVHGHVLARDAIERQRDRLAAMTLAERATLPSLERGRADVLIPGIAICLGAMAQLGFDSLVVSDWGLREGVIREILTTGSEPSASRQD
jgi:exopolyphosphatase/guanosine-5'-triphosphate,3'-diphosphate pyrophosphatase